MVGFFLPACSSPVGENSFLCLDLSYISALLRDGFKLGPDHMLTVRNLCSHGLAWHSVNNLNIFTTFCPLPLKNSRQGRQPFRNWCNGGHLSGTHFKLKSSKTALIHNILMCFVQNSKMIQLLVNALRAHDISGGLNLTHCVWVTPYGDIVWGQH